MKRLLFFLSSIVVAAGLARGQESTVRFQPDRASSGPGGTFSVTATLDNPRARAVAAYQFYLGFDADLLSVEGVTWPQDAVLDEQPFATWPGDGRVARLFPEWRDGQGLDVVSMSGFRPADADPGSDGVLCVITFRVRAATRAATAFAFDPGPYASFTGVFDNTGASIPVVFSLAQVALSTVAPLGHVQCTRADYDVAVTWDLPQMAIDAILIYRDSVLVRRLPAGTTTFLDRSVEPGVHTYAAAAEVGGTVGPRETCIVRLLLDGPQALLCVYDGRTVALAWTLPFAYGYIEIVRNGEFLARLAGTATEYDDAVSPQGETVLAYEVQGFLGGMPSEPAACEVSLTTQEGIFLRGDTNMDGKRELSDAVRLLRYLFSGAALKCLDAADFDDSGLVQINDAIGLLAYLFSGGAPPAPPMQAPGVDPTPDGLSCAEGLPQ